MKTTPLKLLLPLALFQLCAASARADQAVMEIQLGKKDVRKVVINLYANDAPQTVENFEKLARKRFYNGIAFHRVFPHTLVQAGDPLSRKKDRAKVGTGGPGYTLPPEFHRKHVKGAVAMSRLPDTINPARR